MSLLSVPSILMKQTALLLNLFVSGIAFIQFYRAGYFKKNLFIYFALGSIPASFFGGMLNIDPLIYKRVLSLLLLFATVRIFIEKKQNKENSSAVII